MGMQGADPDAAPGRDETPEERADRNWAEILQELRAVQTGTQILTGFLLAIAFQPVFAELAMPERLVRAGSRILIALLAVVSLLVSGVAGFIFDVTLGRAAGVAALVVALAAVAATWLWIPRIGGAGRRLSRPRHD